MLHVLVVEDNPGDIPLINEAVRTFATNAEVLVAYDGEQAMRCIQELAFKPNIIFLDLNVPKINGLEILERQGSAAGPPVVVLTSSSNPEDKRRALKFGAIDYIEKPLDLLEYFEVIYGTLERWVGEPPACNRAV